MKKNDNTALVDKQEYEYYYGEDRENTEEESKKKKFQTQHNNSLSEDSERYDAKFKDEEFSSTVFSAYESTEPYYYQEQNQEGSSDETYFEEIDKEGEGNELLNWVCEGFNESEESKEKSEEESVTSSGSVNKIYAKLSPFNITWSFGTKENVELINLTTPKSFEVFYVSSHFGVIYNYSLNTMTFLPGHNYPINSISSDASGRWLVSADAGDDTVIVIWDNERRLPVWSLYNVFPGEGTKCVKLSQDARYLAAINCNFTHTLKFWLWTRGREEPDGTVTMDPDFGKAKHIDFNHMETKQLAVTMELQVIFCEWKQQEKMLDSFSPGYEFSKKKMGVFRESIFLDDNHTVITSTSLGQVVVWCDVKFSDPVLEHVRGSIRKKYLKTLKIQKTGITSLRLCDGVIISSSEDGTILFHDQFLRLMYWIPKLKLDPLVSLSFNAAPVPCEKDPFSAGFHDKRKRSYAADIENAPKENPPDCTVAMRPFAVRDFIFLTATGKIGYVSHKRMKVKYYLYESEAPILSVDCNPHKSHVVVGNTQGRLALYDYACKKLLVSNTLVDTVTTLKYSSMGHILMAGLQQGTLLELDSLLLTVNSTFDASKSPIEKICFSANDELLAYYDKSSTVYVYAKISTTNNWKLMGNYISHYKPITDILFEKLPENLKHPRLFTIGEDRMLVEYDTKNLAENKLKLIRVFRIEQSAIPCCFAWLFKVYTNTDFPQFFISNNEYKLKVIDVKSLVCQKTTLGPTADTPINWMVVGGDEGNVHGIFGNRKRLIYATQKHIGIRILPSTGNPYEGMGMVAHPEKLVAIAISYDQKYVFTAGVNDMSLLMWEVNPESVEISSQLGGVGLDPFISLIEGGPNSFLFKEIEDFFYYAQIIHQGEDPDLDRSVSKALALCEIPDLFRSLGYYPTDYEVDNILWELKHLYYEKTGKLISEISFDECVKAFLNHRRVRGISIKEVNKALLSVADLTDPTDLIVEKGKLFRALEERGEAMDHAEVVGYLCILLLPKDESNPLPTNLKISDFAENVLGIDMTITEENVRNITHSFEQKDSQIKET